MKTRSQFARAIANMPLSHKDRAVALLWYYRQTQQYEERTPSELAKDLHEEGFPKSNLTRLTRDLARSRYTVRGRRPGTVQVDVRRLPDLETDYGKFLSLQNVPDADTMVPADWVAGTRVYLEQIVRQINGSYDYQFYDACAALCRRLMETLIIEIYIHQGLHQQIQDHNSVFLALEKLIAHVRGDKTLALGRNTPKTMDEVKRLGDVAAHDRTYITQKQDIDDVKARYRTMINELLGASGIRT